MNRFKANCALACLVGLLILISGIGQILQAQETMQGSTIFGTITDTSGAAVAGATVEVTSPALQGAKVATSDSDGAYRVADLPAGVYHISYSKDGFQTDVRTDFTLTTGFAARVDVALKIGSVTQTVEVSGQAPVIDTSTSVTSNTLVRSTLDDVPTTRSVFQAVYMTAGIRPSATPDIGGSQLGNQQSTGSFGWASNATMLVEGINVLQSNSLNAGVAPGDFPDFDALEELKVISTGADADTGPPGTLMVAVMKSGGNEFHGDARGMGEWNGFQRTNLPSNYTCVVGAAVQPCADNVNQLQYFVDAFGDVGGRIIRDKLWFYGGYHLQRNSVAVIGYIGPNGGQGFSPLHQDDQEEKVTYQISKNVKLIGDYNVSSKIQPQRNGGPTIAFPSTWIFFDHFHTAKGEVTWTPSAKLLVDILGGNYWQVGGYPDQPGHYNIAGDPWTINETTGVNTGPVRNLTSGSLGTHNRLQYTASVGYFPSGKHSFQFGTMIFWPQRDVRNLDAQLDNYEVQLKTVAGVITPFQLLTFNIPQNSTGREKAIGLYAKDTWRVSRRLTINPGIRFDHYRVYHDAEPEPGGNFYAAATYPAQTDIVWNRPAPRIGLAYDLTGDGKTVLRASYGQYNIDELGQFDITWYNPGGITTTTYSWTGPCVVTAYTPCDASAATLSSLGTGTTGLLSVSGGATGIVNPNLKQPYMQTGTVTVERQIMPNLAVRALFVYNQENNMFGVTYPNRPISDYNVAYTGTPAGTLTYPSTDPVNGGKPLTIYTYPSSDNCPTTNPVCPFNLTEMVNRTGDPDHYQTVEFTMTKLESHKWSALAAVDLTKSHEWLNTASPTVFATTDYSAAQPVAPYQEAFPLNKTWDWAIKSYFTYQLPYQVQVGLNYQYLAGAPNYATDQFSAPNLGTVYIPVNQWGSERAPALSILNIRIAKIVQLSEHKSLTGSLELFNALNNNSGTTVNYVQGAVGTAKQFGFASVVNPPMIGRLGIQFKF